MALSARLEGVDVGPMMQQIAQRAPLQGRLAATLRLDGVGARWDEVVQSATGSGALTLRDGALTSTDLGARVIGVVAQALQAAGRRAGRMPGDVASGRTELRDATLAFRAQDGALVLTEPLAIDTAFGGVRLEGRIGLDRSLDLSGMAIVAPGTLARLDVPLQVPVRIGGTLAQPEVRLPPPAELAASLARPLVREQARRLEQRIQERAREQLGDLLPGGRGLADLRTTFP